MNNATLIRALYKIYDSSVSVHTTNSKDVSIKLDLKNESKTSDYAVLIHESKNMVMIWDLRERRLHGWNGRNVSYEKKWNEISNTGSRIEPLYKKFKGENGRHNEKIIILSTDTLYHLVNMLSDLMLFDTEDQSFPDILKTPERKKEIDINSRCRVTTSRWNRSQDFRDKVLSAYNYQCAICRCTEEKILQAAHITPVKDSGSDELSNGICLCANHHLMLDEGLIKIDYEKHELMYVADSVRNMPWHDYFIDKCGGKLIKID